MASNKSRRINRGKNRVARNAVRFQLMKQVNDLIAVQSRQGTWDSNAYQHGILNGLICAKAVLLGTKPEFFKAPQIYTDVLQSNKDAAALFHMRRLAAYPVSLFDSFTGGLDRLIRDEEFFSSNPVEYILKCANDLTTEFTESVHSSYHVRQQIADGVYSVQYDADGTGWLVEKPGLFSILKHTHREIIAWQKYNGQVKFSFESIAKLTTTLAFLCEVLDLGGHSSMSMAYVLPALLEEYRTGKSFDEDEQEFIDIDNETDMVRLAIAAARGWFRCKRWLPDDQIDTAKTIVHTLMQHNPITPLLGDRDEWMEVSSDCDKTTYQNRRCGHVFQVTFSDGSEPLAYDLDGYIFREPSGSCYTSSNSRMKIDSFPYTPIRNYIDVLEDGSVVNGDMAELNVVDMRRLMRPDDGDEIEG